MAEKQCNYYHSKLMRRNVSKLLKYTSICRFSIGYSFEREKMSKACCFEQVKQGTGTVKLTGACLPRRANLPMDPESIQASHFVFLSPEVLNGEAYLACDDSYAVGLLALELIFRKRPYKEHREWSLDQFAREVNPLQMLNVDEVLGDQPEDISALISKCFGKADDRPRAGEFLDVKFPLVDIMQKVVEEHKPESNQRNYLEQDVLYRR